MTDEVVVKGRRRVPRRPYRRRVGLLINGRYHIHGGLEIGEGGMLISSGQPLVEGQRVVVAFYLPELAYVVCRGLVRYIKTPTKPGESPKYGIQFETIDFESKRHIRNYVASKSEIGEWDPSEEAA